MPTANDPFPYFPEAGTGGFIYVGAVNQDAQTNPITVYRDAGLTLPWAQPIRTVDGYPAYQGAKANIYTSATSWSITVKNANGETVTSNNSVTGVTNAADVNFTPAGAGAVVRTVQAKLRETVSIDDFGAVGDGATNDAAALTAACTYLAATGGIVELTQTKTYAILSNVTIPPNVYVRHGAGRRGNPGNDWATGPIASQPHIKLASTATISMLSNSGLEAIVIRNGMTIPAANTSAYAGTAIRLGSGGCNDVILRVLVIGFAICVDGTNGGDRQDWIVEADGNPPTGFGSVIVGPSFDSGYVRVRTYPWGTVAFPTSPVLTRSGMGTQILAGVQDDTRFDLMDYGHSIGIECKANGNMHFEHVWCDNNATSCLDIYTVDRVTFDAVWLYAASFGVRMLGNGTVHFGYLMFDGTGGASSQGIWTNTGIQPRITISHLRLINCASLGISLNSTTARINVEAADFSNINGGVAPYIVGPVGWTSDQVTIGRLIACDLGAGSSLIGGNPQAFPTVASNGNLLLPITFDHFLVTGTTNITTIGGTWNGRRITLTFAGVLTVTNGATLKLAGGANFVTAAGSSIGLYYDQANSRWVEMWRNA